MTAIAQTSMIAASLAILVYLAVITTGNYLTSQNTSDDDNPLSQQSQIDSAMHKQISSNLNYSHTADTNTASLTILLNGLNLNSSEFIPLYDSTPYASKGHIQVNLPCDDKNPIVPMFQVLVGRAPDLAPTTMGYIGQMSKPPKMCVYHAQFGFGDPVTDIILKNVAERSINLTSPHSIVITTHESYIPTAPSFKDIQHQKGY
jgi:hypothetical protein